MCTGTDRALAQNTVLITEQVQEALVVLISGSPWGYMYLIEIL